MRLLDGLGRGERRASLVVGGLVFVVLWLVVLAECGCVSL